MEDSELPRETVIAALGELGLAPLYAQRAAGDTRIVWTEAAIIACAADVANSGMKQPARALWSQYLQHGQLPPVPRSAVEVPPCPACGGDLAICNGVHGWIEAIADVCHECDGDRRVCRGVHPEPVEEQAA